MILNANAEKGASSLAGRSSTFSVPGSTPLTGGISSGEGRESTTASSIGWTPLLRKAVPQTTGTILSDKVAPRIPLRNSVSEISLPSRYFSMIASSPSAAASDNFSRDFDLVSLKLQGSLYLRHFAPCALHSHPSDLLVPT